MLGFIDVHAHLQTHKAAANVHSKFNSKLVCLKDEWLCPNIVATVFTNIMHNMENKSFYVTGVSICARVQLNLVIAPLVRLEYGPVHVNDDFAIMDKCSNFDFTV
jgi:hypothetical protein